jgi:hypothetical protein
MTIPYTTLCAMMAFPERDAWLARRMTRAAAAALSPIEKRQRRLARERLRKRKPAQPFAYNPMPSFRRR